MPVPCVVKPTSSRSHSEMLWRFARRSTSLLNSGAAAIQNSNPRVMGEEMPEEPCVVGHNGEQRHG